MRQGAKVTKQYHAPATPYQRLLASDQISASIKQQLQAAFAALDPVQLLQQIRSWQQELVTAEESPSAEPKSEVTTETFLQSLRTAWQAGEVRPTHRKRKRALRTWRTKPDPFAAVWPHLLEQLQASPEACAKDLFQQLQKEYPGVFPDSQLRTLQRRVKQWRSEIARRLIMSSEEARLPVFALEHHPRQFRIERCATQPRVPMAERGKPEKPKHRVSQPFLVPWKSANQDFPIRTLTTATLPTRNVKTECLVGWWSHEATSITR